MRQLFVIACFLLISLALKAQPLPDLVPYKDTNGWGYMDTTGKVVIPGKWEEAWFYRGDRAMVKMTCKPVYGKPYCYCTINRKGEYIITPDRNWTGFYNGWAASIMNTCDSNGNWGLIDTDNHLLIPNLWSYPQYYRQVDDSLKVVEKDGFAGLINLENKLVLPCRYGSIESVIRTNDGEKLVLVTDPDNRRGHNKIGLVKLDGQELLPTRYYSISYYEQEGKKGFWVTIASDNESVQFNKPLTKDLWIDYPSLKEGTPPKPKPGLQFEKRENGYIFFTNYPLGRPPWGIMDTSHNVLIPCCSIEKTSKDTFYQAQTEIKGDSVIITRNYLNTATLQPYCLPVQKIIYHASPVYNLEPTFVCGNGARAYNQSQNYAQSLPRINIEGYNERQFFKDTFLYLIEGYAYNDPLPNQVVYDPYNRTAGRVYNMPYWLAVEGKVRKEGNYQSYGALVDDSLRYIVKPMMNQTITAYNQDDDIVTVSAPKGNRLISSSGIELMSSLGELSGGFRWHKRVYGYAVTRTGNKNSNRLAGEFNPPQISAIRIVDTDGKPNGEWKYYHIIRPLPTDYVAPGEKAFIANDSSGLASILDPEGNILYPAICHKYKSILPVGNGWYYVNATLLKDKYNHDIIPGLVVTGVAPAHLQYSQYPKPNEPEVTIPRLLLITGFYGPDKKPVNFYMAQDGVPLCGMIND